MRVVVGAILGMSAGAILAATIGGLLQFLYDVATNKNNAPWVLFSMGIFVGGLFGVVVAIELSKVKQKGPNP